MTLVIHLFILWFALAGAAILWRAWLTDHPRWKEVLTRLPWRAGKTLLCGSCFTYWIALGATMLFDPLGEWTPPFRTALPEVFIVLVSYLVTWMVLAWGALVARFGYVAIQEYVAEKVHAREDHGHAH